MCVTERKAEAAVENIHADVFNVSQPVERVLAAIFVCFLTKVRGVRHVQIHRQTEIQPRNC